MKHISTLIFICTLLVLLEGCTSKGSSEIHLPAWKELQADSLTVPPVLLSVNQLFTINDMLVAYQQRNDTLFSFWKLPECSYLFQAGTKGQGPNDFLMLDRTFQPTQQGFKAFEIATNRVKEVTVKPTGEFNVTLTKQLNVEQQGLNRFLFLENDSYCFVSDREEYEYALLSREESIHYFSDYPQNLLTAEEGTPNRFTYNKLVVSHPEGNKFAAFYAYVKLCRIYNSQGELLKETLLTSPSANNTEERHTYYSSYPCADANHIYILTKEEEGTMLEVWNWEGILETRYLLDKPVTCITRPVDGILYALCRDKENVIYTYPIP